MLCRPERIERRSLEAITEDDKICFGDWPSRYRLHSWDSANP
jgi:hypothetical protein